MWLKRAKMVVAANQKCPKLTLDDSSINQDEGLKFVAIPFS